MLTQAEQILNGSISNIDVTSKQFVDIERILEPPGGLIGIPTEACQIAKQLNQNLPSAASSAITESANKLSSKAAMLAQQVSINFLLILNKGFEKNKIGF